MRFSLLLTFLSIAVPKFCAFQPFSRARLSIGCVPLQGEQHAEGNTAKKAEGVEKSMHEDQEDVSYMFDQMKQDQQKEKKRAMKLAFWREIAKKIKAMIEEDGQSDASDNQSCSVAECYHFEHDD